MKDLPQMADQGAKKTQYDQGYKNPCEQNVSPAFQEPIRWLRLPGEQALEGAPGNRRRKANQRPDPTGGEEAVQANVDLLCRSPAF